jgi:hypothetical protein
MDIGQVRLRNIRFPDRAGEFQDAGATASLVRELGDNYGRYHEYLAREGQRLRDEFDPGKYGWDLDGFGRAAAHLHEIVMAESLLRACRTYRRDGKRLGTRPDSMVPLVDNRQRLLSLETGQSIGDDPGVDLGRPVKPTDLDPPAHG